MSERSEIDLKKVEKLIDLMKEHDLIEVELVDGKSRVHLRRPEPPGAPVGPTILPIAAGMPAAMTGLAASVAPEAAVTGGPESNVVEIPSPMIGTFYSAPGPDADPYVRVGSKIRPGTVVCIVEAMKVMNEIKADCKGVIEKILVDNASPVMFGQALFKVRPQ
jgi:acetyl-CoA carboxylase biotin carboxyl carrier protein